MQKRDIVGLNCISQRREEANPEGSIEPELDVKDLAR